jgi:hypothetical protein
MDPAKITGHTTVQLGDLVAAVFEEAARDCHDPRQISRLATSAVMHLIWRARRTSYRARRMRFY